MEIIANCQDHKYNPTFIVQMGQSEIDALLGGSNRDPVVGQTINVREVCKRLEQLVNARAEFDAVQKKLVAISAALGPLANIVEPKKEEDG